MLQQSKLIASRDAWRSKAVERANQLREARKTQKRHQQQLSALKHEVKQLQQALDSEKKD